MFASKEDAPKAFPEFNKIEENKDNEHIFQVIKGDEEKETFLILMVHGIGSDLKT